MSKDATPTDVRKLLALAIIKYGEDATQANRCAVNAMLDKFEHTVRVDAKLEVYERGRRY